MGRIVIMVDPNIVETEVGVASSINPAINRHGDSPMGLATRKTTAGTDRALHLDCPLDLFGNRSANRALPASDEKIPGAMKGQLDAR
jgi:hypothetical protein